MKITPCGGYDKGTSNAHGIFDNRDWYNENLIEYVKVFSPLFKKGNEIIIETKWYYFIVNEGQQILEFHSIQDYCITELDLLATNNQIEELIIETHRLLSDSFEETIKEFKIFQSVHPLSQLEIQQAADQLSAIFREI